jgi:hypothetical protein
VLWPHGPGAEEEEQKSQPVFLIQLQASVMAG